MSGAVERPAALQFADRLLPATIRNARKRAFYRDSLPDPDEPGRAIDVETIQSLPFTDRARVQAGRHLIVHADDGECEAVFTGGSTGAPLAIPIGAAERHYIDQFHRATLARPDAGDLRRRGIVIHAPYHLHEIVTPVPMAIHRAGIYETGSFAFARERIASEHNQPGVASRYTVLAGWERLVRAFTLDARAAGFCGDATAIELILTSGQQLTRRWRRRYEKAWGARVIDRFGLTEAYGGATEDPETGWYLFDPPCFPEVVDPAGDRRVQEGIGELVLTPLYPFQRAFPLIRYRTGDLVDVTHVLPGHEGVTAIRPLGRMRSACATPSGGMVPASICYEVVDALPGIARTELFLDARQLRDRKELGHPRYRAARVDRRGRGPTMRIDLQWRDGAAPLPGEAVAQRIRDEYRRSRGAAWPGDLAIEVGVAIVEVPDNPSYSP